MSAIIRPRDANGMGRSGSGQGASLTTRSARPAAGKSQPPFYGVGPLPQVRRRPVVIIIRDGWGQNPYPEWNHANAVHLANTPVADQLMRDYPTVLIRTSGEDVGLPAGVMGNSEVGHQNIGAGRIVDQEVMRITRAIRDGSFYEIGRASCRERV